MYIGSVFSYNILFAGEPGFECIVVSVSYNFCKLCVCVFYKPPNCNDSLDHLLATLFQLNVNTCMFSNCDLVGDFNIDFSNQHHPLFAKLVSITSSFSLVQVVKDFTRFNPNLYRPTVPQSLRTNYLHC